MAEDAAEVETRRREPKRDEEPELDAKRGNGDQSQAHDSKVKDRSEQEGGKPAKPLPRWPLVLAGLVVVIFAAALPRFSPVPGEPHQRRAQVLPRPLQPLRVEKSFPSPAEAAPLLSARL